MARKHVVERVRFNGADDGSKMEVECLCGAGPFGPGDGPGSWAHHKFTMKHDGGDPDNAWKDFATARYRKENGS